jgi:hypothetical protein
MQNAVVKLALISLIALCFELPPDSLGENPNVYKISFFSVWLLVALLHWLDRSDQPTMNLAIAALAGVASSATDPALTPTPLHSFIRFAIGHTLPCDGGCGLARFEFLHTILLAGIFSLALLVLQKLWQLTRKASQA